MARRKQSGGRWLVLQLALLVCAACAKPPKHQWGVERIRFEGVEAVDPATLRACLATHEREAVELGLSALMKPKCGVPPFDNERASARLWSWPWKDWPTYDESILKLDIQRIERWYQARGYYRAHVTNVEFKPPAMNQDAPCKEDCEGEIIITVSEGEPVKLRSVEFQGIEALTPEVREELQAEVELEVGGVFDEALYEKAKETVKQVLREAGYARAGVEGQASVHRGLLFADVDFRIAPGPICTFGAIRVVTNANKVPTDVVLAVAKLEEGTRYSESELREAQHAVYSLGAFASVRVRGDFEAEPKGASVPILIEVSPRRESEVMVGAGVMSGVLATGPMAQEYVSVPQWDVHLLGSYSNRNFFGGLRQFRIEERPRMLFLDAFPRVPDNSPQFANAINLRFSQPGVIEPRTTLFLENGWDYGPDPFQLFFRHEVANAIGLERGFLEGRLQVRVAAHYEFQEPTKRQPIGLVTDRWARAEQWIEDHPNTNCIANPSDPECAGFADLWIEPHGYHLPFVEERVTLDLRDDGLMPTKGGYFAMGLHQAIPASDRSWSYLRLTPDARAYAPLGLGFVLAARFAIGSIHIFDAGSGLDAESKQLGPQTYRLRGGGANGNRGFQPGELGDSQRGGIRRWESSLELRIPLAANFSLAAFGDMGDVHAGKSFRFDHLNTAVGGGLRYRTIIGPIRLDVGYRPKKLQRAGGGKGEDDQSDLGFAKFPGAIHLTIGESF